MTRPDNAGLAKIGEDHFEDLQSPTQVVSRLERSQSGSGLSTESVLTILKLIFARSPLPEVLTIIARLVESQSEGLFCCIWLLDEDGKYLDCAAAPSLPGYSAHIGRAEVCPKGASCGTAVYRRETVCVTDILTDPIWENYRDRVLPYGIRSAWSRPLFTREGKALGAFSIHYREPCSPSAADLQLIENASDITGIAIERHLNEECLRRTEAYLTEAERLSHSGSFVWDVRRPGPAYWSAEMCRIHGRDPSQGPPLFEEDRSLHSTEDWAGLTAAAEKSMRDKTDIDYDSQLLFPDGSTKNIRIVAHPVVNSVGDVVQFIGTTIDVTERKRNEAALRESVERFHLIVDSVPGFVTTENAAGEIELVNRQVLEYFGKTTEDLKNWSTGDAVHPDDLPGAIEKCKRSVETGQPYEYELRHRRADGVYRWFQARGLPLRDSEGRIIRWYTLLTDIDDRKRAEGELAKAFEEKAKSEAELRTIIDAIPQLIVAVGTDGSFLSANQAVLEYTGLTIEEIKSANFREAYYPEDVERLRDKRAAALSRGIPFEYELRVRRSRDGQYRWFLIQYNPLRDERGEIIRWYATGTDIDDRKQAEEKTLQENVVLREQIDQVFMFEEIVGSSLALKTALSSIVKVAPTDSTVLITGETGTGKELIARAIHKNSERANKAFITVNCTSIPSSLIASELFGHEKGAFTGALQRRQGRFELAHGGTIFLDEIGELPAETQIALLRVLQERQFERVGGTRVIATDVRVIAATNRDLPAAIASGTFRADLFYRLNVFPIDVPPLRNRTEDIPMLVEYFVKRYAEKARKQINKIDKNTLRLCQSYHWPGNIRELQNIVERSVILSTGDTFRIEQAWLSSPDALRVDSAGLLTENLRRHEKELIEAALAECKGRVAGPNGAAAKLGVPPSTLHLKIKQLDIKKNPVR